MKREKKKFVGKNKIKMGQKINGYPQGEHEDERCEQERVEGEKRDGMDLKYFHFPSFHYLAHQVPICKK